MSTAGEKVPLTRGQKVDADISALIRARNSLLWVSSIEELRVERALTDIAAQLNYEIRFWDCIQGLTDSSGKVLEGAQASGYGGGGGLGDPKEMLAQIRAKTTRTIYVMRDLHRWVDPVVLRAIRTTARAVQRAKKEESRVIVLLTPSQEVPADLKGQATVIDYPIPDRAEVAKILADLVSALPEKMRATALADEDRDMAIDAAVGLTADEASNCYSRSLVTDKRIDPAIVASEKKRVIAREKVLTWHDPDPRGLSAVGGLDVLKGWLEQRKVAFSAEAREFGLPSPKGLLLVGPSGTGKSLTAKCVSTAWKMPLLRIDFGALQSKWVGESQANIRRALAVAESVSPCVVWCDEIEKAMAGASSQASDGGVAADALGMFLTWMQERQGSVFVIATANDVKGLPPEFLRKGRFDEVFWIDLPGRKDVEEILAIALREHKRDPQKFKLAKVAEHCGGFIGAEVAAIVPDALFEAFSDGKRELRTTDLVAAAKRVTPLSKTAGEKIAALREWAKGRARPAATPEAVRESDARDFDLEPVDPSAN